MYINEKNLSAFVTCSLPTYALVFSNGQQCFAICQEKSLNFAEGKLTSNVWRSTVGSESGNTVQWDYVVSAVYSGDKDVKSIKNAFKGVGLHLIFGYRVEE